MWRWIAAGGRGSFIRRKFADTAEHVLPHTRGARDQQARGCPEFTHAPPQAWRTSNVAQTGT